MAKQAKPREGARDSEGANDPQAARAEGRFETAEPAGRGERLFEPEPEEEGWVAYPSEELEPMEPVDAARYIAQMTRELSAIAANARLETLSYLLSMSAAEAEIAAEEAEKDG